MKSKQNWSDMLPNEIIYQHENITHEENGFTKPDLIAICNGKEDTARALFDLLDWQHPATLLDEWENEGEIDKDCNLIKQTL